MKKLGKLTLNEMQSELSVLQLRQCQIIKGGDAGMDCVFHAIAFAAGVSYAQVATAYGDYVESLFNMQDGSDIFADQVNYTGMSGGDTEYLANLFGLSNVGDTPQGAQGYCEMGDQSVGLTLAMRLFLQEMLMELNMITMTLKVVNAEQSIKMILELYKHLVIEDGLKLYHSLPLA